MKRSLNMSVGVWTKSKTTFMFMKVQWEIFSYKRPDILDIWVLKEKTLHDTDLRQNLNILLGRRCSFSKETSSANFYEFIIISIIHIIIGFIYNI